jgi:energy-coupling factor transporter ATP-binding protein EcfA2
MTIELSGRPLRNTRRDRALFVNREPTIAAATKTARSGGNVLLVGSRGSGKSSLLRMLAHTLDEEHQTKTAVIDGRAAGSALEFLTLVRDQLGAWDSRPLGEVATTLATVAGAFLESPQVSLRPPPGETQTLLGQLREIGRSLPDNAQRVVLVDEMPSPQPNCCAGAWARANSPTRQPSGSSQPPTGTRAGSSRSPTTSSSKVQTQPRSSNATRNCSKRSNSLQSRRSGCSPNWKQTGQQAPPTRGC